MSNGLDQAMAETSMLLYWRNETSGKLAAFVYRYVLTDEPLTEAERDIFASYLRIWAMFPVWQQREGLDQLRESFDELVAAGDTGYTQGSQRRSISQWLKAALMLGIDPL